MGGRSFTLFFMNRVFDTNGDIYYHMVVSDDHPTFQTATPTDPCLISVLIALLLGNGPESEYTPPHTENGAKYVPPRAMRQARKKTTPKAMAGSKSGITRKQPTRSVKKSIKAKQSTVSFDSFEVSDHESNPFSLVMTKAPKVLLNVLPRFYLAKSRDFS
jgi:hypothetical protein